MANIIKWETTTCMLLSDTTVLPSIAATTLRKYLIMRVKYGIDVMTTKLLKFLCKEGLIIYLTPIPHFCFTNRENHLKLSLPNSWVKMHSKHLWRIWNLKRNFSLTLEKKKDSSKRQKYKNNPCSKFAKLRSN